MKRTFRIGALTAGAAAVILLILLPSGRLKMLPSQGIQNIKSLFSQNRDEISGSQHPKAEVSTFRAQIASTDFHKKTHADSDSRSLPPAVAEEPAKNGKSITPEISEKAGKAITAEENKKVAVAAVVGSRDDYLKSTSEPGYSTILGQITVQRSENLSEIIKGVYGEFKTSYLESVIKANPDIEDPDRVEIGQIISLPVILVDVKPGDEPVWWIKVKETDVLEPAFNVVRNRMDGINPMRLIPYWTPGNGTKFAVVLNKLFKSEQSARSRLEQLPVELASNSIILSLWNRETVYFADPYSGRNH